MIPEEKSAHLKGMIQGLGIALIGFSCILTPIYLRFPLLSKYIGAKAYVNYPAVIGALLLLGSSVKRHWSYLLYQALIVVFSAFFLYSDIHAKLPRVETITTMLNVVLPMTLYAIELEEKARTNIVCWFMRIFNGFVLVLLGLALCEKLSDGKFLQAFVSWYESSGYETYYLRAFIDLEHEKAFRFAFIWGHTLNNAAYFTAFFILNDVRYRSLGRKYPKLIFFLIALSGVLLCAAKTASVVLIVYYLLCSWRDIKQMILTMIVVVFGWLSGAFGGLIRRFTHGKLTSGRLTRMSSYLSEGQYPFHALYGYGSSPLRRIDHLYTMRNAFDWVPVMFAISFGVVAAAIHLINVVWYGIYRCIRNGQILTMAGLGLWFIQIMTFYHAANNYYDTAWYTYLILLIGFTCADMAKASKANE